MSEANRRYERIEIELPVRLFVPGAGGLRFEASFTSRNLGLGGVFVSSDFLLPEGMALFAELRLPAGPLAVRSRVAHVVGHGHPELETGLGIEFLELDARGREALLRYFTPAGYQAFHAALLAEFPHLGRDLPLDDVALVLNLWEEWKVRREGGPASIASGAPPATPRRGPAPPSPARPAAAPRRPRGR